MFSHSALLPPANFAAWIEEIRPQLKPPVGNKLMFGGQQKIMVVGGPNTREDYHIEEGEELFLQLSGDMVLETMERGARRSVRIPEGHIFALPGRVPHSPQRLAGTVGLVVERDRLPGEMDGLRYYTRDGSGRVLFEEWFACTDLGVQLKPVIERFFASECCRTGVPEREYPPPPLTIDETTTLMEPVRLAEWVGAHTGGPAGSTRAVLCGPGAVDPALRGFQFTAAVFVGPHPEWAPPAGERGGAAPGFAPPHASEVFLYALPPAEGAGAGAGAPTVVTVREVGEGAAATAAAAATTGAPPAEATFQLPPGHVMLVPGGRRFAVRVDFAAGEPGVLVVTNAAFR